MIGACPAHTVKGDMVAFIAGAHVPFILSKPQIAAERDELQKSRLQISQESTERTQNEAEARVKPESWKLVGKAYVHGAMHGEIDAEALRGIDIPVETIQII